MISFMSILDFEECHEQVRTIIAIYLEFGRKPFPFYAEIERDLLH